MKERLVNFGENINHREQICRLVNRRYGVTHSGNISNGSDFLLIELLKIKLKTFFAVNDKINVLHVW
jgi:hypothetical protein